MRFGLFGSAQARRGGPDPDSGVGFREFVDYNVGAESLGFVSTFMLGEQHLLRMLAKFVMPAVEHLVPK